MSVANYSTLIAAPLVTEISTTRSTGPSYNLLTGNIYFVQSTNVNASDTNNNWGSTPSTPFKTLNNALSKCVANNGDVIYVLPNHVETVAAAAALTFATGQCDGVTVYFLGAGAERAIITFATSTAAQVTIPANNVTLIGAKFNCTIDALVAGLSITGSDCTLENIEWFDNPGTASLIQVITTNAANRLTINGYTYYESTTGTSKTEAIRIVGGDHHRLTNLNIKGSFSTANFNNVTTATTNFMASNWYLANPLTTAAAVPLQAYVSTSTFMSPDVSPAGGVAGVEYIASKTIALPQGTTAAVFTVTGGPIQILQITGLITTVIGSVANATKLTYTPTVAGTSTDLCATTDLNAAAAGDMIFLQTSFATAFTLSTNAVESIAQVAAEKLVYPLTVPPGQLIVNCAGSDGGTGRVQWCMRYKPLATGVIVK